METLSDKIQNRINKFARDKISDINCIIGIREDIKVFIKRLMEKKNLWTNGNDVDMLTIEISEFKKLAGDKLI